MSPFTLLFFHVPFLAVTCLVNLTIFCRFDFIKLALNAFNFVRGYTNPKISLKVGKKLIKKSLKRTPFADLKIFTGIKKT